MGEVGRSCAFGGGSDGAAQRKSPLDRASRQRKAARAAVYPWPVTSRPPRGRGIGLGIGPAGEYASGGAFAPSQHRGPIADLTAPIARLGLYQPALVFVLVAQVAQAGFLKHHLVVTVDAGSAGLQRRVSCCQADFRAVDKTPLLDSRGAAGVGWRGKGGAKCKKRKAA